MNKIKIANQPVGPFSAMLVGAIVSEKPTYTTVGAGGCACLDPVLCVSLKNTHYITQGIMKTGYFSVNIPSSSQVKETDFCGIVSGKDADKSKIFNSFYDPAGRAPLIEECPLNFLCKVESNKKIRGFTMFFGEIAAVYISQKCLTDGRPDPLKIDPIIMMGFSYCNLNSVLGRPFAEGKNYDLK